MSRTAEARAWAGREAASVRKEDVEAVLSGESAFLLVRGYVDPGSCGTVVRRFLSEPRERGDYWLQVGMVLAPGCREDYFSRTRELNAAVAALYDGMSDPAERLGRDLSSALGWSLDEPSEGGVPYCRSVVIGMPPGTVVPLHTDFCLEEREDALHAGLFMTRYPRQFSWNVYFELPEEGGELVLYRRSFRPDHEPLRVPDGKSFCPGVVVGIPRAVVRPRPGDLVLFDPDHYHEVPKTGGSRHRVSAHSRIAADPGRGRLAFWT